MNAEVGPRRYNNFTEELPPPIIDLPPYIEPLSAGLVRWRETAAESCVRADVEAARERVALPHDTYPNCGVDFARLGRLTELVGGVAASLRDSPSCGELRDKLIDVAALVQEWAVDETQDNWREET